MRRRALVIIGAVVVVALAGSFGVMQQRRATASDRWVTATATTGSVTQTLSGSGTVSPAEDASASFPASGKVTAVKVSVGQTVKAGDVLATMDETSLQTAVDQAALTLAQARETLAETETAAASASAASASAATASASTGSSRSTTSAASSAASSKQTSSGSGASSSSTGSGGSGSVKFSSTASVAAQLQAQKKVVARAQSGFDSAWAAFSTQLSTTTTECDSVGSATPSASASSVVMASRSATPSASSSSSTPTSSATPVDTQKCLASLDTLAAKQDVVSSARGDLETAVNRIVALATASTPASSSTGSTTSPGRTSATSSAAASTGSGSNAAGGSGSGQSSAAASSGTGAGQGGSSSQGGQGGESKTVAQAAAAVAQAKLDLATARVALTNATMTAPISGTISAVPFAVGDEASTSDTVDIVGGTGVTLSLPVGEDDIRSVKVGQSVEVSSVAGSRSEGTVSAIGVLASSGTTSEVTYPVTVEVLDAGSGLVSGTTASALVTIASAKRATLVPVSAVTLVDDSTGIVKVVGSDHAVTATRVSLGAIGSTRVQITKGISSGATVALADSTSDLPTSGSTSTGGMGMGGGQGGGNAPRRAGRRRSGAALNGRHSLAPEAP
ncbi:MAG: biotin/lipoyl-binding protein [Acidipropionibacterium acidipropionici]|uniref:biotin/lipoyl-binding protein n=1 Tax=Acidipropionibacterium acidipropionici TaxID=1748 RepID=UPI002F35B53A